MSQNIIDSSIKRLTALSKNTKITFGIALLLVVGVFGTIIATNALPMQQALASYVYSCPEGSVLNGDKCVAQNKTCNFNNQMGTIGDDGICRSASKTAKYLNIIPVGVGDNNWDMQTTIEFSDTARTNNPSAFQYSVPISAGTSVKVRVCRQDDGGRRASRFHLRAWKIGEADLGCASGFVDFSQSGNWKNWDNLDTTIQITGDSNQVITEYERLYWYRSWKWAGWCTAINGHCNSRDDIGSEKITERRPTTPIKEYQAICPETWQDAGGKACAKSASLSGYVIDSAVLSDFVCNPASTFSNTKVNCKANVININGQPLLPSEGLYAGLLNNANEIGSYLGNSDKCTLEQGVLTCNNVPVPSTTTIGRKPLIVMQGGNKPWQGTKGFVDVYRNANLDDFKNSLTDFLCNSGQSVLINTKTSCTFTLPQYVILPTTTQMSIGNGDIASSNCNAITTGGVNYICNNVSTGSLLGSQPVKIRFDANSAPSDTGKFVNVISNASSNDLTSILSCLPNPLVAKINTNINCRGTVPANIQLTDVKARVGNNPEVLCVISGQSINQPRNIECNNITVGSNIGLIDVTASSKENTSAVKIATVKVVGNLSQINGNLITCNNNASIVVNNKFDCSFILPSDMTLSQGTKLQLGDAKASDDCMLVSQSQSSVICKNLTAPAIAGAYDLYSIINGTKANTGKKINVVNSIASDSNISTVRSGGIGITSIVAIAGLTLFGFVSYNKILRKEKTIAVK
jgi:hypothetical protein